MPFAACISLHILGAARIASIDVNQHSPDDASDALGTIAHKTFNTLIFNALSIYLQAISKGNPGSVRSLKNAFYCG
jgi:hypothetical protein